MASIRKAGKSWEVFVSKNGVRKSATFSTKIEAQNWGAATEADIIAGKVSGIPDKTFGDLLSKYANEVSPNKRGSRWEIIRINKYLKDDIAKVHLRDLNSSHFAAWRDMRLKEVGNGSVLRERNSALGIPLTTATLRMFAGYRFSIETALRAGELCVLERTEVFREKCPAATAWLCATHATRAPSRRPRRRPGCNPDALPARRYQQHDQAGQGWDDQPSGRPFLQAIHREPARRPGCRPRCSHRFRRGLVSPLESKIAPSFGRGFNSAARCCPLGRELRFDLDRWNQVAGIG